MSKAFAKILTICSLVLVLAATVIGSAICLSTVYGYDVVVDSIINGNDNGFAKATIFINGKEYNEATNKVKVKKGEEVSITFSVKDTYCENGRIVENYPEGETLDTVVENGESKVTYKTVVNKNLHFAVLHDAYSFSEVSVQAQSVTGEALPEGITASIDVGNSTIEEKDGKLYAQVGTEVKLQYTLPSTTDYKFEGWAVNGVNITGDTFKPSAKVSTVIAKFKPVDVYGIYVNVVYDVPVSEVAAAGAKAATITVVNGETTQGTGNIWYVKQGVSSITLQATQGTGYKLVGWGTTEAEANQSTTTYKLDNINGDRTVYVKFAIYKYTITYKTKSATSEEEQEQLQNVQFGTALKSTTDYYKEGWNLFDGWTCGGKDYKAGDVLTFNDDGTYEFVAKYKAQKGVTYTLTVEDAKAEKNTISYNVVNGFDANSLPVHAKDYYKLVGVNIDGKEYRFSGNKFDGADQAEGINAVLAKKGMDPAVTVAVKGVWEWTFTSFQYDWSVRAGENDSDQIEKTQMLSAVTLGEIVSKHFTEAVYSVTISVLNEADSGVTVKGPITLFANQYKTATLQDVLDQVTTAVTTNAKIHLKIVIVPQKTEDQKKVTYNLRVKEAAVTEENQNANVITYKTVEGITNDTLPTHEMPFYKLVGVKIGGKEFRFSGDKTFANADREGGINEALAAQGMEGIVNIDVEGIWEWTFESLQYKWTVNGSGETDTKEIDKNTMLSTINMGELMQELLVDKQVSMITVSVLSESTGVTASSGTTTLTAGDYASKTFEQVLRLVVSKIETGAKVVLNFAITAK